MTRSESDGVNGVPSPAAQSAAAAAVRHPADGLDAAGLVRTVWARKWWIALATSLTTLAAVAYALMATQWYRAESILMPREGAALGGLSAQLSQFSGLIDMAGLGVGQTSKQEPLGVLRSVGFARRFIERNDLAELLSSESGLAIRERGDDPDRELQRLAEEFGKSVLTVGEDRRTGLVTVGVEWRDPQTAADWANGITRQINEEMRQRSLDEATRNVEFLRGQLERTETVSLQQAIARLVETEMQKVMLAQGTAEYAFRVIDAARPPAKRSWPKRTALVLAAFAAGLFASVLGAVLLDPCRELLRAAKDG
jgi:uncharacterized protein involved in exopolysaccharide biosynthesis